MIKPRFILNLILVAVLLAACASKAAPTETEANQAVIALPEATSTLEQIVAVQPAATEPAVVEPQPAATSRGPDLHATDPSTVSLVSGGLQFVEFFRFT
jgi:hypothetical protein